MAHYGHVETITDYRQEVLNRAYEKHPERFINKKPKAPERPDIVWINPPQQSIAQPELLTNFDMELSQGT